MKRPCLTCGTPQANGSRCTPCERQHQQARNAARPGHRATHAKARALLAPLVAEGVNCYRCGQRVTPPWDADNTPQGWKASHARCNREAGGRGDP